VPNCGDSTFKDPANPSAATVTGGNLDTLITGVAYQQRVSDANSNNALSPSHQLTHTIVSSTLSEHVCSQGRSLRNPRHYAHRQFFERLRVWPWLSASADGED
jgi:hypothetical protein